MGLTDLLAKDSSPEDQEKVIKRLSAQMQVNQQLSGLTSLDDLLWRGAEAKDLVEAEQLFIYALIDKELITRIAAGSGPAGATAKGSSFSVPLKGPSLAAHVARTALAVTVADVDDAAELKGISPELVYDRKLFAPLHGKTVRQVLCAPVVHQGKTIGVLEAVNKATGEEFDFMDVACMQETARNLAPMMHQVTVLQLQSDRLTYTEQFNRLTARIHSARNIDQILLSVHRDIQEMFNCERLTIYAVDHDNHELYSKVKGQGADSATIKEIRVAIDHSSIAGYVAATESMVNIEDVYDEAELAHIDHDLKFNKGFDKVSGLRTREVLAAPLVFDNKLFGVLQLINTPSGSQFTERDVDSVGAIAEALAIAFANKAHTATTAPRTRFDKLMEQKLLSEPQLANARAIARENALFLEDVLSQEFKLSKQAILESYSLYARKPSVDLEQIPPVPADLVATCAKFYDELKSGMWCPVATEGEKVIVAIEDPRDLGKIDLIQGHFMGRTVDFRVAMQSDIIQVIDRYFSDAPTPATTQTLSASGIKKAAGAPPLPGKVVSVSAAPQTPKAPEPVAASANPDEALRQIKHEMSNLAETDSDDSGGQLVRLVNLIIEQAYHKGASDIHIEPYLEEDLAVRYRVDGQLKNELVIPKELRNSIVSRIKIMAEIDIAERRKPQDGKIKFNRFGRLDIELRVATLPTAGGCEDVVMRILAASKPIPLDKIGMSPRNFREFTALVEQPYGIILCVGPTGSGKTTTLHSALGYINQPHRKIWTAEDPVEITQRGLRQVQVNPKAGLTFATAMRSFLRADPDVIMVGEMRDRETTGMGIEASLTGHLVFSTLHTNNAPETITRLTNMEVDVFAFGDALLCILAQRLMRTLCKDCKVETPGTDAERDELRREYAQDELWEQLQVPRGSDFKLWRAKEGGCAKCNGSGYRGRMGLHELLVRSPEMRDLIYKEAQAEEIRHVAMQQGMRTLKQDGVEKVLAGSTDLRQVHMVCTT